jgi:anti-anti-sigma factor
VTDTHGAAPSRRLSIDHATLDGIRVVVLRGEIDHTAKEHFTQALLAFDGTGPARTVLDFSDVTFMDSSGINVLVAAHQAANSTQGWVRIAGAGGAVRRILHIVGVDQVIECHPTIEQALHN